MKKIKKTEEKKTGISVNKDQQKKFDETMELVRNFPVKSKIKKPVTQIWQIAS